jgi:ABC-type antimicrobial peptide transport system permease subunit
MPQTTVSYKLEASMTWQITLLGACGVIVALISLYFPSIYIRKTNKMIALLEQIAANNRK